MIISVSLLTFGLITVGNEKNNKLEPNNEDCATNCVHNAYISLSVSQKD